MADYYPVLVRAISGLSDTSAPARQELYERARAFVIDELRRQNREKSAPEVLSEQAALEAAILRVEAESASIEMPAKAGPPPAPAILPAAAVAAQSRSSSSYFSNIFWIPRSRKPRDRKPAAPAAARPHKSEKSDRRIPRPRDELGGILDSLGGMLLGTLLVVAAIAFTGVLYIRGLVWVSEDVIAYPMLLVATAITLCLLVALPLLISRNGSTLSAFGFFSRLLYSASRRMF